MENIHYSHYVTPALRIIGNTLSCSEDRIVYEILTKFNLIDILATSLNSKNSSIRKEVFWALSNIAASDSQSIAILVHHDCFFKVCSVFTANDNFSIISEASWIICNAINGSIPEIQIAIFEYENRIIFKGFLKVLSY